MQRNQKNSAEEQPGLHHALLITMFMSAWMQKAVSITRSRCLSLSSRSFRTFFLRFFVSHIFFVSHVGPNEKETEDRFLSLQERQELRRTRRPCGTWTWPPLRRRTCRQAARSRRLLWEPAGSNLASCRGCLWRRQCAGACSERASRDGVRRSESASFVTHKCDEQSQRSGGVGVFLELRHGCLSRASGWDLLPGLSRRRATSHKPGNARMQL